MTAINTKERFLNIFSNKESDRLPDFEFGYWDETLVEWKKQGLPENITSDWEAERYFGFDYRIEIPTDVWMNPKFEQKIIKETDNTIIFQDTDGTISEKSKFSTSIPRYIKFPVESRSDWNNIKNRFIFTSERIPKNLDSLIEEYSSRDYPLGIHCGSMYGRIRDLMGVENLSITLYEDRSLVEEIMETFTELTLNVLRNVLPKINFDYSAWWEDICFNKGPLISPKLFDELAVPRYRKIVDYLQKYNVKIHILDCDGNINELVPLWLKSGINCMFPLESAHTDAIKLKRKFGKDLFILGAVNKIALIKGKKEIDDEIKRIKKLISLGGVIPHVDHRVPPDVTLENYLYYIQKKREIL